ncbi:16S rRNA (cytidine(1402)-2'-O)-methyltransferase [Candidatus Uhrbacteria bacterium]|nr:16S rRNA (cytidine(1402)-2'-O)-methyltransferase [Candidatus Uhrbacteria bacterium]
MVATPIGNMGDLSPRARDTLSAVHVIFAEDTRVAMRLLKHCGVETPVKRYDHHVHERVVDNVMVALQEGDVAYVSDAGVPGVEEPGGRLVEHVVRKGFTVTAIPGASAVMAALSLSGFRADAFRVMGFPPTKKGREKFFEQVAATSGTVVIYESVHRIQKTLDALAGLMPQRQAVVARELTKRYEQIFRGSVEDVARALTTSTKKGEYIVVLQ